MPPPREHVLDGGGRGGEGTWQVGDEPWVASSVSVGSSGSDRLLATKPDRLEDSGTDTSVGEDTLSAAALADCGGVELVEARASTPELCVGVSDAACWELLRSQLSSLDTKVQGIMDRCVPGVDDAEAPEGPEWQQRPSVASPSGRSALAPALVRVTDWTRAPADTHPVRVVPPSPPREEVDHMQGTTPASSSFTTLRLAVAATGSLPTPPTQGLTASSRRALSPRRVFTAIGPVDLDAVEAAAAADAPLAPPIAPCITASGDPALTRTATRVDISSQFDISSQLVFTPRGGCSQSPIGMPVARSPSPLTQRRTVMFPQCPQFAPIPHWSPARPSASSPPVPRDPPLVQRPLSPLKATQVVIRTHAASVGTATPSQPYTEPCGRRCLSPPRPQILVVDGVAQQGPHVACWSRLPASFSTSRVQAPVVRLQRPESPSRPAPRLFGAASAASLPMAAAKPVVLYGTVTAGIVEGSLARSRASMRHEEDGSHTKYSL
mmetsp:Transcript_12936/g.45910  ORF Transcript_12936/g.45910 Transcript_12936/m.45910 type:complete len:494 (+) Transcript_12936:38-1519(+)